MSNDQKIEKLLRQAMTQDQQNSGSAPGQCPDDELLAAYLDGGLDETRRQTVESHLDSCEDCRLMLGLAYQSQEEHSATDYSRDMVGQVAALARPETYKPKPALSDEPGLWSRIWAWLSPPRLAFGAVAIIVTVVVLGVWDPDQPEYMVKTDTETAMQVPAEAENEPMMTQEEAAQAPGAAPAPAEEAADDAAPAPIPVKRERAKGASPRPKPRQVLRYEQPAAAAPRLEGMKLGTAPQSQAPRSNAPMISAVAPRMTVLSLGYYKLRTRQAADFRFIYVTPVQITQALAGYKHEVLVADMALLGKLPAGWQAIPIARYPLAVVVNKANPVQGLSKQQLSDIFSGKTDNWLEVGGPDEPIEVLALPSNTYAAQLWKALVGPAHGGASVVPRLELMHYVAQTPAAIGYAPIGQIMGMVNSKALAVDGVSPLQKTSGYNKTYKFGGQVAVVHRTGRQAEAEMLAQRLKRRLRK